MGTSITNFVFKESETSSARGTSAEKITSLCWCTVIHIMWLEVSVAAILEYLIKLKCCFQCCFYTLSKQVNLLHKV